MIPLPLKPRNTGMLHVYVVIVFILVFLPVSYAQMSIEITEGVEPRVGLISNDMHCEEGLVEGKWVGLSWSSKGLLSQSDHNSYAASFVIGIGTNPGELAFPHPPNLLIENWQWIKAYQVPGSPETRHLVVELENSKTPIRVEIHTLLDGTDVMTRWLRIKNLSSEQIALLEVLPWVGKACDNVNPEAFKVGYHRKGILGWFDWQSLTNGRTLLENRQGTGYDDPFFVLHNNANQTYFICHLAWTANWKMVFDCIQDKNHPRSGLTFQIGPVSRNPLRVINPGETIESPKVHLGYMKGRFDEAVHAMHQHIRRSVIPKNKPQRSYLIEYSIPKDSGSAHYRGDAFNEENLKKCIDVASAVGAELFIIDCGWWDIYGEWEPSAKNFPDGLDSVVGYAHQKGLLFGLYTEVEGGRGNWWKSQLFKDHPDWFGPNYILRLDRPEVAAYMETELRRIIDKYDLDLYRHDFIPGYTYEWLSSVQGSFTENNYWRYYKNYYGVWDRIHRDYPDLILQMCSNGGTREDLAMMSHFHETYSNEGSLVYNPEQFVNYSQENYYALPPMFPAYAGKTVTLPPEVLVYGVHPFEPLDTHLRVMFTLSTPWIIDGPAGSLETLKPHVKERYLHYANLYKTFIRPMWPTCKVIHHSPVSPTTGVESSSLFAMEFVSADQTKAWATIVRASENPKEYLFKPKGLNPKFNYEVTFDSSGQTKRISGAKLIEQGLSIYLESVLASELLLFEAESK